MQPITGPRLLFLGMALLVVLSGTLDAFYASVATANDYETQVLTLVNRERAAQGLAPFAWQSNLTSAARAHSQDLAARNTCSHSGADGSDPGTRIARAGYAAASWGETVACGQKTPEEVVRAWMNSPSHHHILMGAYQEAGVGYRTGPNMGHYWTVEVGTETIDPDRP